MHVYELTSTMATTLLDYSTVVNRIVIICSDRGMFLLTNWLFLLHCQLFSWWIKRNCSWLKNMQDILSMFGHLPRQGECPFPKFGSIDHGICLTPTTKRSVVMMVEAQNSNLIFFFWFLGLISMHCLTTCHTHGVTPLATNDTQIRPGESVVFTEWV